MSRPGYEYEVYNILHPDDEDAPVIERRTSIERLNEIGADGWQFCMMWGPAHALFMRERAPSQTRTHRMSKAQLVTGNAA